MSEHEVKCCHVLCELIIVTMMFIAHTNNWLFKLPISCMSHGQEDIALIEISH